MNTVLEGEFHIRMYYYIFLISLFISESLQVASETNVEKNCDCYDECSKNFTTNSLNDEQSKNACERGCRFFYLVVHTKPQPMLMNNAPEDSETKSECLKLCSNSYMNPVEASACNFGCSSVTKSDSCEVIQHQSPHIVYSFLIEESDVLVHPGDPDPDDALIDPGLRKQFEKTLESFLDSRPKLPEIHFRNLPILKKDLQAEHDRGSAFKCPKFYGFDSKFEFRNNKITAGDLFFLISVLVFAIICFTVSRSLEKQRKLWRQLLVNLIQNRMTLMKAKENSMEEDSLFTDSYPTKDFAKEDLDSEADSEDFRSKIDGVTLLVYHNVGRANKEQEDIENEQKSPKNEKANVLNV